MTPGTALPRYQNACCQTGSCAGPSGASITSVGVTPTPSTQPATPVKNTAGHGKSLFVYGATPVFGGPTMPTVRPSVVVVAPLPVPVPGAVVGVPVPPPATVVVGPPAPAGGAVVPGPG